MASYGMAIVEICTNFTNLTSLSVDLVTLLRRSFVAVAALER